MHEQMHYKPCNLLPYDGVVYYYGTIMPPAEAHQYYEALMKEVAWRHDEAIIYGRKIITRRKVAWYADQAFSYTYSKTTKTALPWIATLQKLKDLVERESGETYNACLLNLYHDGGEGMAWHSDAEKELQRNGAIASLSLGAERKFSFKHKQTKETVFQLLEHGSLLVMKGTTQSHWRHCLPPMRKIHTPRVNLTFRTIGQP